MPKINQEEYEVLKGLDDEWKWIARDENSRKSTFPNELWLYEYKPKRMLIDWLGECGATKRFGYDSLFQFIGDKDSEPYNVAELIEEYESEETEVKNIEWLKEETEKRIKTIESDNISFVGSEYYDEGYIDGMRNVLYRINQLDEPETLSQEWIDENKEFYRRAGRGEVEYIGYIRVDKLENLLVAKQEKVKIPQFVADWHKQNKHYTLSAKIKSIIDWEDERVIDWYENCEGKYPNSSANAQETIALMDIVGYEIEKPKKYRFEQNAFREQDFEAYSYEEAEKMAEAEWERMFEKEGLFGNPEFVEELEE